MFVLNSSSYLKYFDGQGAGVLYSTGKPRTVIVSESMGEGVKLWKEK